LRHRRPQDATTIIDYEEELNTARDLLSESIPFGFEYEIWGSERETAATIRMGDVLYLSSMPDTLDEEQYEMLVEGKSKVTRSNYERVKEFIMKGLLTTFADRKASGDSMIVGGSYKTPEGRTESRIFSVWGNDKTQLLWSGTVDRYREAWTRIRNEKFGVPKRSRRRLSCVK